MEWKYQPVKDPKPQPARAVGSERILEAQKEGGNSIGCAFLLFLFGLPFLFMGLIFLFAALQNRVVSENGEPVSALGWMLFSSVFVLIGGFISGAALIGIVRYLMSLRFEPPTLSLSHTPMRAGDALELKFSRSLKNMQTLNKEGQLSARLVCAEVTKRTAGTDTVYDYKIVWQKDFSPAPVSLGSRGARGQWKLTLPSDARASFYSPSSWLVWHFQVRHEGAELSNQTAGFLLEVV